MATPKKIILLSSDNHEFVIDAAIAMEFVPVKSFFDEPDACDGSMPLPNVSGKCLSAIIEYCKSHLDFRSRDATEDEVKAYNDKFVNNLDNESLKEMVVGSNYLEVKYLLDMLNQAVADRIKNKSVAYVRGFFGIENDYTPEEEAKIRAENEWAFEGVDPDEED